jgi:hypoxanthine-DNA glycosylase
MHQVESFAPITNPSAKILILGSMPGVASLKANQYYAHPRNAFWPIMGTILNFDATLPYPERINALKEGGVALWDVLQQCERPGSLDNAIKSGSRIVNDFDSFFQQHPHIQTIAFNGAEAEKTFKKHVLTTQDIPTASLIRLPSTSPAHTLPLIEKLAAWRHIF